MLFGVGLGLVLGMVNGVIVAVFRVPSIVATLGTLSIYRGIDFLIAGGKQVTLDAAAGRLHGDARRATVLGIPVFVLVAVAIVVVVRRDPPHDERSGARSTRSAATRRGRRSSASGRGLVTFVVFSVVRPARRASPGVMWGILFGTINATSATGVTLQVVAAVVVGGVNIFGGSGTVIGAALGALFLTFIGNALILVRLSQFWLQALYGLVILIAVALDAVLVRQFQRSVSGRRAAMTGAGGLLRSAGALGGPARRRSSSR